MEDATNSAADDEWVAVDASDAVDAPKPRTVQHLRSIEEWDAAIASPTPILVDFAAAWCGPCQAIAPHFSRLAEHATALTLFRLDVDEVPEAQEAAGVTAMPTFQVWRACEKLEIDPPAPEDMIGSLAAFPLPAAIAAPPTPHPLYLNPVQDQLRERYGVEVPIAPWPDQTGCVMRISAQLYNHLDEYRYLAAALEELLANTDR